MNWYYAINGQRLGPVPEAELQKLVTDGVVKADTLVWKEGMAEWQPYAQAVGGAPGPAPSTPSATDDGTEVCVVTGQRHPRREMVHYDGKWISAAKRDEYFQRLREGVTVPGEKVAPFGYGGFWIRFVAKFLDGIITGVAGIMVNLLLAALILGSVNYFVPNSEVVGTGRMLLFQVVSNVIGVGIGAVYVWFFLSRYSATPGKMAVGLKIVRADGTKLSTGRIIGRYFAEILSGLILLIGYIMAAFDEEKRSLHDRICDTRVIKTR
ncbi:MAG: RDD family protein [Opitutaceae bacterium]|nr:RDD family protein [Opitutaceae bacterium]